MTAVIITDDRWRNKQKKDASVKSSKRPRYQPENGGIRRFYLRIRRFAGYQSSVNISVKPATAGVFLWSFGTFDVSIKKGISAGFLVKMADCVISGRSEESLSLVCLRPFASLRVTWRWFFLGCGAYRQCTLASFAWRGQASRGGDNLARGNDKEDGFPLSRE